MKEQEIRSAMQNIANDIQEDFDMWTDIQKQLTPRKRHQHRRLIHLSRAAAIFGLLLVSTISYGFFQGRSVTDEGLQAIQQADLQTPLNLSEQVGQYTVGLEWAYADTHRIAVGYSITPPNDEAMIGITPDIVIRNREDNTPLGFGTFGGAEDIDGRHVGNVSVTDLDLLDEVDTLALAVDITLVRNLDIIESMQNSTTSGGGGGGSSDNRPATETIGSTTFMVDLSVISAIELLSPSTQTSNDITVELQSVSIAPSMTRVSLCYESATAFSEGDWYPAIQLQTDKLVASAYGNTNFEGEANRYCGDLGFLVPYQQIEESWLLRISAFERPISHTPQEYTAALEAYGLEVELRIDGEIVSGESASTESFGGFGGGGPEGSHSGRITFVPEGVDVQEVIEAVNAQFTERIEGTWQFAIEVPSAQ